MLPLFSRGIVLLILKLAVGQKSLTVIAVVAEALVPATSVTVKVTVYVPLAL